MLLPPLQGASQAARLPASKPPPGMAEHCAGRAVAGVGVPSLDAHSLRRRMPPPAPCRCQPAGRGRRPVAAPHCSRRRAPARRPAQTPAPRRRRARPRPRHPPPHQRRRRRAQAPSAFAVGAPRVLAGSARPRPAAQGARPRAGRCAAAPACRAGAGPPAAPACESARPTSGRTARQGAASATAGCACARRAARRARAAPGAGRAGAPGAARGAYCCSDAHVQGACRACVHAAAATVKGSELCESCARYMRRLWQGPSPRLAGRRARPLRSAASAALRHPAAQAACGLLRRERCNAATR